MTKGKDFLSQLKLYSDYLKWDDNLGRYETWEEACDKILNTHLIKYGDVVLPLLDEVRASLHKKEFLASQRNLQFRGDAIFKHNAKIYNCCTTYAYSPDVFNKGFYVLLSGTGLGVSLKQKFVSQLPKIHKRSNDVKLFIVPDSIEGWSESIKVLISSYCKHPSLYEDYFGHRVKFDYSQIRDKGAFISGGFKAPGYEGLKKSIESIELLLNTHINGYDFIDFKSIIVYDVLMYISDAVLSGGVRRSAMNVIIDENDEVMLQAKTGNWRYTNPQRARSNNSVGLIKGEFNKEKLNEYVSLNQGDNDLGFVFMNHEDEMFNPCFEIGFNFYEQIKDKATSVFQFCVGGDTKLITKTGIENIRYVVDREIEIWNGVEWSKVSPYKTGENDVLNRVYFSDGSYLDATNNHKFLVKNRFEKQFKEVETLELIKLLKTSKYGLQIPRSNFKYENLGINNEESYNYGFILGDGNIPKKSKKVYASLYSEDKKIKFSGITVIGDYYNYNNKPYTTIMFNDVDFELSKRLKYEIGLPKEIFNWNRESIINFISGWADADGSIASKGIRIYGDEEKLRDGQLLLSKIGIDSSINLLGKKGTMTNLCERKNGLWYLQITTTNELKTQRLKTNNSDKPKNKGKYQLVKKIETLNGTYESYCLTEEKLHQCVFNNVLTKQCNLDEINASACIDSKNNFSEEKFYELCRYAAIIGTLQAGYTEFPYLGKQTEDIVRGEALIGVSITGWMTRPELFNKEILTKGAEIVKKTNKEVSELIGINQAARTTTVKPSGNAATILKTSSGIHPEHSKRYFRIMQLNKDSETAKWIEKNTPSIIEDSQWSSTKSDYVVYSPCENNENVIIKDDMKGVKHLEYIKLVQNSWINGGKNVEKCYNEHTTHNVSNTVIIDDINQIVDYIFENQSFFAAVSFLSSYGDKDYTQAPFTSVLNTQELVERYGDGAIFMSGLVVDGLHYFDDDLWTAVSYIMDESKKLIGDRDQTLLKKDWIRRVRKFSKNYFKGDINKTIYCMKDVHLWHKWKLVNREFKLVNFGEILTKPTFEDISKYGAISCNGGACEIP